LTLWKAARAACILLWQMTEMMRELEVKARHEPCELEEERRRRSDERKGDLQKPFAFLYYHCKDF
jgi:hypothetical protein